MGLYSVVIYTGGRDTMPPGDAVVLKRREFLALSSRIGKYPSFITCGEQERKSIEWMDLKGKGTKTPNNDSENTLYLINGCIVEKSSNPEDGADFFLIRGEDAKRLKGLAQILEFPLNRENIIR